MPRPPANADYVSRAATLDGFDALAARLGRDPAPMLKRFGFPPEALADPDAPISYNRFCALLEACAVEWQCPDFGLRLGQSQNLSLLGPIGLMARVTPTVGAAMRALADHLTIHSTGIECTLDAGDPVRRVPARAVFSAKPGSGAGRQSLELSLAVMRNVMCTLCANPEFAPLEAHIATPRPADSSAQRAFFRCPLRYEAEENALLFDAALLRQPTAIHDAAYAPLIRTYLDGLSRELDSDVAASTRRLIRRLLTTGQCNRDRIAECLNMSPRTFQRRLEACGTSFSALLDEHRQELALDLVRRRAMPLAQIASALGFADQSVFNQAFRRWTGSTPSALQRGGA